MFARVNNFDKLLDKATSNLRLDPDWPTILQICDLIRQNDCTPKYAVAAIKKKLYSPNPHQAMFGLLVLESIVKNCGSGVHDEITSKGNCEMFRELVKTSQHENLRNKLLELIQAWAFAFRNTPKYRSVQDTVNIMKTEGYKFPPLKESDAMFSADCAPEWSDGDVCHRCRVAFTLMMRKHHCRACGQVFCQQCSSKTSTIPKFGIEKEVRVCDACFDKVSRPPSGTAAKPEPADTANDYGPAPQKRSGGGGAGGKTAEELQEEEELQLALALSQSEAEHKEKERKRPSAAVSAPPSHGRAAHQNVSPSPSSVSASPEHSAVSDPELTRYLDRGYWEQRREAAPAATAPAEHASRLHSSPSDTYGSMKTNSGPEDGAVDIELEEFVAALKSQIEIFVNRMKSNSSRGRSIANDTSVQTLFMNITAMHSRLLRYIQLQDDSRVHYESLQDKVAQARDSRAALDTLRAEHAARLAAAAEAAERQRQMQMAHKLHVMRKKKHEYLQYQRQLALQRVQEQEREMQMRQEQQKQQYLMSASGYFMPGAPQYPQGFPGQPMYPNAQYHQMMPPQSVADAQAMQAQPQITQPSQGMQQPPMGGGPPISQSSVMMGQMPRSGTPSQMMIQQMHQMRMQGVHSMMQQGGPGGPPGQPGAPQGQTNPQLLKQGQNQPQGTNPVQMGQMGPQMNPNQMMGVQGQLSSMRVQGMPPVAHINSQGQPLGPQGQHLGPQVQQMSSQGQPMHGAQGQMPMQGQLPPQGQQMPHGHPMTQQGQVPPQGQHMPHQGQQMPQQSQVPQQGHQIQQQGQQMPQQGQQMPQQGQQMPHQGQQMPPQGQHMPLQGHQIPQQGQQMPQQGQSMPSQGKISQGQQIAQAPQGPSQGQMMPPTGGQGQVPAAAQPGPMGPTNNYGPVGSSPQHQGAQPQPAQAPPQPSPVKPEQNPLAELISFD